MPFEKYFGKCGSHERIAAVVVRLTRAKESTLNELVERLSRIPNLLAVVLGGSHASGMAGPGSDLDLGIYYRDGSPFAIEHVRAVVASVALPGSQPTITGGEVDLIYRNLDQVEQVIEEGSPWFISAKRTSRSRFTTPTARSGV